MEPKDLIDFLNILERLKDAPRHATTSGGRRESVAEHSWRLAVMALLLRDDFPQLDMDKVLRMCLVHDWGEAVTGDIPAFEKSAADERVEDAAVAALLARLPAPMAAAYTALFAEMREEKTEEARLWRALDKLEALIQHNESDTATWLPLEHDLQQTYGQAECTRFPYTAALREVVRQESACKTAAYFAGEADTAKPPDV